MEVPSYLNLVSAENAAAGMSRGLVERTEDWGRLVAIAQRILASAQNEVTKDGDAFSPDRYLYGEDSPPLIAAARILDAASRTESIDSQHRQRLALCAAAAFSMAGNFPSAHAAIQVASRLDEPISELIWLAIGCFSPRHLKTSRLRVLKENNTQCSLAIETLQIFLATGDQQLVGVVDSLIVQLFAKCSSNLESLLLGYARVSLHFVKHLSVHRNLSVFPTIASSVVRKLLDEGVLTLLPSQFEVLCRSPLLNAKDNALVCLPTSTGKTLIGELAIASGLNGAPGLAIYVAPYIAIGMQAARALTEHLPEPYRIHVLLGDLRSEVALNPSKYPEVVVTTPERLDAILRREGAFDHLKTVLIDEAHVVSDGVRGVRLEALLARLRLRQRHSRSFRIVCLSAVMAESLRFRSWLGVPDSLFLTCTWRPTARRVAIWRNNNRLTWLYAGDELRPQHAKPTTIFGSRALVWPERMYPASHIAQTKSQQAALYTNAAYLCRQMQEEYLEPVLCVCASRASSRGIAYRLAYDLDPIEVLSPELIAAVDFIDSEAPHLSSLKQCLIHGVAFHNAALPIRLRQLIERAVETRALKIVCATTTLAEGVDLPFRVTVLAEWLQWRLDTKDQQKPFGPLKFRNIVGRSGRAGVFTEGDTIVFENVLGPSKYIDQQNRTASILSMMERPNEVASALEEDVNAIEMEVRRRVISSNFLAAIPENPSDDALDVSFAEHMLASTTANGETTINVLSKIRTDVLNGGEMAFATAASPLKLTAIGNAANRSLFSPESCRVIVHTLQETTNNPGFEHTSASLLITLGALPEQHNTDWAKVVASSSARFVVKPDALPQLLNLWHNGVSLPEMFGNLPAVRRSKARDDVNEWLAGRSASENWSNNFDKFTDFVDSVVEKFLPAVFDACALLSNATQLGDSPIPWDAYRSEVIATIERRQKGQRAQIPLL